MTDYKYIDLNFLENFANGDKNRMSKYINMFLQGGPAGVDFMKNYCAERNWESLKSAAHSLKPQIGYMGIEELKEVIQRIEEYAGQERRTEELPALIDKVDHVCRQACEELRSALKTMS